MHAEELYIKQKLPFYTEQLFTSTPFTPNSFYTKELLLTSNTSYAQDLFRLNTFKLKHCVSTKNRSFTASILFHQINVLAATALTAKYE